MISGAFTRLPWRVFFIHAKTYIVDIHHLKTREMGSCCTYKRAPQGAVLLTVTSNFRGYRPLFFFRGDYGFNCSYAVRVYRYLCDCYCRRGFRWWLFPQEQKQVARLTIGGSVSHNMFATIEAFFLVFLVFYVCFDVIPALIEKANKKK